MLDKAKVKALRPLIDTALRGSAAIVRDFHIEVGAASFDPALGEVTFRVKLTELGAEADAKRDEEMATLWNMYEPAETFSAQTGKMSPNPLHGKYGATLKSREGVVHKLVRHNRAGNIITTADDGREYVWKRPSVVLLMGRS